MIKTFEINGKKYTRHYRDEHTTKEKSLSPRMTASKKSEKSKLEFRKYSGDRHAESQLKALKNKMK